MLNEAASHASRGDRLKNLRKKLEKERAPLDAALAGQLGKTSIEPLNAMRRMSAESVRVLLELKRDQHGTITRMTNTVLQDIQPTAQTFERLRQDLQVLKGKTTLPPEARTKLANRAVELPNTPQRTRKISKVRTAMPDQIWRSS
jgi:hypothetical protein